MHGMSCSATALQLVCDYSNIWMIQISPDEIPNNSVKNGNSPPRREMILRRNEMILRKIELTSPKNFPTPHWTIKDLHRGIFDFLHRDVDKLFVI